MKNVINNLYKLFPTELYTIDNGFRFFVKDYEYLFLLYNGDVSNLNILAERCNIKLDERKTKIFVTCNSFNISARYEDYKNEFYERCTEEYTSEQIKNIEEVRTWLKEMLM